MFKHEVEIRRLPELRGYAVAHTGAYLKVVDAFGHVGAWVAQHGLTGPGAMMIGIFYDDPDTTPEAQLRAKACFVPAAGAPDVAPAPPVERVTIAGGDQAGLLHPGPGGVLKTAYQSLGPRSRRCAAVRAVSEHADGCGASRPANRDLFAAAVRAGARSGRRTLRPG